jgi:hypothetical protein
MLVVESIAHLSILYEFRATFSLIPLHRVIDSHSPQSKSTGGFNECPQMLNGNSPGINGRSEAFYFPRMSRLLHFIGVCGVRGWHVPSGRGVDGDVWRRLRSLAPATKTSFLIDKAFRQQQSVICGLDTSGVELKLPPAPRHGIFTVHIQTLNSYSGL